MKTKKTKNKILKKLKNLIVNSSYIFFIRI